MSGKNPGVVTPRNCDPSVRRAIQQLAAKVIGLESKPSFAALTLSDLTASRLLSTDSSKALTSVSDLTSWIAGVTNETNVTDDGDGTITIGIANPLIVAKGGTGAETLTDHGILLGSGTDAITPLGAATNGQLPIGSTGADPVLATLTGTANQVTVTNDAGSITLATPQNIHTDATPEFNDIILGDWQYNTPTYDSVHDWMNTTQSAGLISGGIISDATGGKINVTAGTGFAKSTDSEIDTTLFVDWSGRDDIAIAPGSKYTVYIDYTADPQVKVGVAPVDELDHTTKFAIGSVFYDGTAMHILNEAGTRIYSLARRVHQRARTLRKFERATGLVTGKEGTRHISVTPGIVYAGLNVLSLAGMNSADPDADTFDTWYYDGDLGDGAWVKIADVRQLDNVQYNDVDTGLANLGTNRYGVHWIFMDVDGHCNVLYGQGNYTLALAQRSTIPASLPSLLADFAILIARVIVQEGEATIIEIATAFQTIFGGNTVENHNELANLQGGTSNEYYHLTAAQHTDNLIGKYVAEYKALEVVR